MDIFDDYSKAISSVSSFFAVRAFQKNLENKSIEFLIADSSVTTKFPLLLKELTELNMIATAQRSKYVSKLMPTLTSVRVSEDNGIVITVSKIPREKTKNWYWMPALLFAATLTVVFIDGIMRAESDFAKAYMDDPILIASLYTASLMGILGVHELGHMLAAKKHGIKVSWPYFIPGIPGFMVPTFGAMILARSNMTNRNVLFDVGVAGPIAGLIVTIAVSIYGASISVAIPAEQAEQMIKDRQLMDIQSSILMTATMYIAGNGSETEALVMSPVLFAAWIGFLLTFLNLLPAWQLDGGHLARSALGARWHRILTYASIGVLAALGYFIMAAFVLLLSSRAPENRPLDDVTPLSKNRQVLFAVALGLAVLCAPLPSPIF